MQGRFLVYLMWMLEHFSNTVYIRPVCWKTLIIPPMHMMEVGNVAGSKRAGRRWFKYAACNKAELKAENWAQLPVKHLKPAPPSFSTSGQREWCSSQFSGWQRATNFILCSMIDPGECLCGNWQAQSPGGAPGSCLKFSISASSSCSRKTTNILTLSSSKTTSNQPQGEKF